MHRFNNLSNKAIVGIWGVTTLLLLITWWHVFVLVSESKGKAISSAERDLANLSRVSQEHADRTFRSADQVIRFIQARYLEIGNRLDLEKLTTEGVIDAEIFPQVGVIDAKGIYTLSNKPIKRRLDLSDREHFKVHVGVDTGELFVSKPVIGRATGKWSIQLTRRITRQNGEFAGVVVVSIDPGYFTHFYNEIKLGPKGLFALYGLDGVARARKVDDKEEFGTEASKSPMFELIARGQLEGAYTGVSVVDGVERLFYYRKIPRYQLALVDGIDTDTLLADHIGARNALILQASLLSLMILAFATALTQYLKQIRFEMKERQMAQARAEDRSEQLNAIFSLSPDGFVAFDANRRVKYASPAFHTLTGLSRYAIVGFSEQELSDQLATVCSDPSAFPGIQSLRKNISIGSDRNLEARRSIEIVGKQKRILDVGLIESRAETVSQILYFRDITYVTEVDRMKSEFLSTAAHELRTPMASIYGYSEIMLSKDFEQHERLEFLGIIHVQSMRMVSIINELLDLARIEAQRGKDFMMQRIDLCEFLKNCLNQFEHPIDRKKPLAIISEKPVWITADPNKLNQAFINVLSNAYKYSPNGGDVLLSIAHIDRSKMNANLGKYMIGVSIRDSGIGMTMEQLSHIFERFYRADSSGKFPGTGLGMSIVYEIVQLHGGQVNVQSEFGAGTTVTIWLPLSIQIEADGAYRPIAMTEIEERHI